MANTLPICCLTIMALMLLKINCAQLFSEMFSFSPSLKDNTCKVEVQLFSHTGLTLIHCTNICLRSKYQSCVGVVYKESQKACYGCRRMDNTDLEPLSGTVSLKRTECAQYLVQDASDSQLSESSTHYGDGRWGAIHARLDNIETATWPGSWIPSDLDSDPYIEVTQFAPMVDFLDLRRVTGVVTQGRDDDIPQTAATEQWVTEYRVRTSSDCSTWEYVTDRNGVVEFFPGNFDLTTKVTNLFDFPVAARCVRINPTQGNNLRSMRFDVLGCEQN